MKRINIAQEFSPTPGARSPEEGPFSGQEFRQKFLEPLFKDESDDTIVHIDLDGTYGYAPSFLEEAFGGLARLLRSNERLKAKLRFTSEEEPELLEDVQRYIRDFKTGGRKI